MENDAGGIDGFAHARLDGLMQQFARLTQYDAVEFLHEMPGSSWDRLPACLRILSGSPPFGDEPACFEPTREAGDVLMSETGWKPVPRSSRICRRKFSTARRKHSVTSDRGCCRSQPATVSLFSSSVTEGRFRSSSCFGSDINFTCAQRWFPVSATRTGWPSPSVEVNLACRRKPFTRPAA